MLLSKMVAITLAGSSAALQAGASATPQDLTEFGMVCFCNSRVATPDMVIRLDNNGRFLFATRNGVSREALQKSGLSVSSSQIRMLKDWGVLREKNKVLTTAFPVLEPVAMDALRNRLRPVAQRLVPLVLPHATAIGKELTRRGQSEAAYALLFSYVLDGLVWEALEGSGKLPKMEITIERPYWAGTFWAVYPKQDHMPGTNGRSQGRAELRMLWTPKVRDRINDFYGSNAAGEWIAALDKGTALPPLYPDANVRPVLVREGPDDPLFMHGSAMAKQVADAMLTTDLARELPAADESQRLLIGTHELVWLALDDVTARLKIKHPAVLGHGARTSSDLAPLVIGILNRAGTPSTP